MNVFEQENNRTIEQRTKNKKQRTIEQLNNRTKEVRTAQPTHRPPLLSFEYKN
ncbi:MAG: hypothetical protein PHW82_16885 [Bacteroidales bacterium]|nr:hypothetical protein [Bacteroidales bacterium]